MPGDEVLRERRAVEEARRRPGPRCGAASDAGSPAPGRHPVAALGSPVPALEDLAFLIIFGKI